LVSAIITLFKCTTGGEDWGDVYDLILQSGRMYAAIFLFFIVFFVFAVFNIVTSIFVDKTVRLAQEDMEIAMQAKTQNDRLTVRTLKKLFKEFDTDHSGTLTLDELRVMARDEKVALSFEKLGLNLNDADHLFKMMSTLTGHSDVDIDVFVASWLKMRGLATSIDQQALILQVHRLTDMMRSVMMHLGCNVTAQRSNCRSIAALLG